MSIEIIKRIIDSSYEALVINKAEIATWGGRVITHSYSLPLSCVITNVACFALFNKVAQKLNATSSLNTANTLLRNLTTATVIGTAIFGVNTLFSKATNFFMSTNTLMVVSTAVFVARLVIATCILKPGPNKPSDPKKDGSANIPPSRELVSSLPLPAADQNLLATINKQRKQLTPARMRRAAKMQPSPTQIPSTQSSDTSQIQTGTVKGILERLNQASSDALPQPNKSLFSPSLPKAGLVLRRRGMFSPGAEGPIDRTPIASPAKVVPIPIPSSLLEQPFNEPKKASPAKVLSAEASPKASAPKPILAPSLAALPPIPPMPPIPRIPFQLPSVSGNPESLRANLLQDIRGNGAGKQRLRAKTLIPAHSSSPGKSRQQARNRANTLRDCAAALVAIQKKQANAVDDGIQDEEWEQNHPNVQSPPAAKPAQFLTPPAVLQQGPSVSFLSPCQKETPLQMDAAAKDLIKGRRGVLADPLSDDSDESDFED